jgi:hypothetical protein
MKNGGRFIDGVLNFTSGAGIVKNADGALQSAQRR